MYDRYHLVTKKGKDNRLIGRNPSLFYYFVLCPFAVKSQYSPS